MDVKGHFQTAQTEVCAIGELQAGNLVEKFRLEREAIGSSCLETDAGMPPLVIDLMPEQEDIEDKGGTMRLGAYPCKVAPGTRAFDAYGSELIYERHRHRYEVSNVYRDQLSEAGMVISGLSPDERLTEMIELPDHPWFVATQAHPEFKSRPGKPHPLFRDFVKAAGATDAS